MALVLVDVDSIFSTPQTNLLVENKEYLEDKTCTSCGVREIKVAARDSRSIFIDTLYVEQPKNRSFRGLFWNIFEWCFEEGMFTMWVIGIGIGVILFVFGK